MLYRHTAHFEIIKFLQCDEKAVIRDSINIRYLKNLLQKLGTVIKNHNKTARDSLEWGSSLQDEIAPGPRGC